MTRRKPTEPDNPVDLLRQLTPQQAAAADLVALGRPDGDVADAVGVTRQTVCVWRRHHPAFMVAVADRRREVWSESADRLRCLLPKAVDRLERALDGPNGWRVALALVKLAGQELHPEGPTEVEDLIEVRAARSERRLMLALGSMDWNGAARRLVDTLTEATAAAEAEAVLVTVDGTVAEAK